VYGVARYRLLQVGDHHVVCAGRQVGDGEALAGGLLKFIELDPQCTARWLHDGLGKRELRPHPHFGADRILAADHRGFNRFPGLPTKDIMPVIPPSRPRRTAAYWRHGGQAPKGHT